MTRIGKYVIVRELGRGGMGVVFEARDPALDRPVAVKLLNDRADPERFLREARFAARIIHPNCVPIFDVGEHDGRPYLVMELVNGVDAGHFLERRGHLPWKTATKIVAAAARGLVAIHDAGLVHRDVKPSNLLISKTGVVKVADFGLARSVGKDTPSLTGERVVGTPHYMSPEQCWNEAVDARTDVYSLGVTYYVLLTGRPPYHAARELQVMFAHCNDPIPDPRAAVPGLPAECAAVVRTAMAKAPPDRYQTARDMLAALETALTAGGTPDPAADQPTVELPGVTLPRRAVDDRPTQAVAVQPAVQPAAADHLSLGDAETADWQSAHPAVAPGQEPRRPPSPADATPLPALPRPSRRRWLLGLPVLAAAGAGVYFAVRDRGKPPGGNGGGPDNADPVKAPVLVPVRDVRAAVGIGGVAVSDDGRWLAVGMTENSAPSKIGGVKLFDRTAGDAPEVWWRWRDETCTAVAFSPDGTLLAVANTGMGRIRVFHLAGEKELPFRESEFNGDASGGAVSLSFSPDGALLAAGNDGWLSRPGRVRVWDVAARTRIRDLLRSDQPVRGVSFAADSRTLAAAVKQKAGHQPLIEVWNAATGEFLKEIRLTGTALGPCAAFARRAPLLAATSQDDVQLYRPTAFDPGHRFVTHNTDVAGVALSPDGTVLAYAAGEKIEVWDAVTGHGRATLKGQTGQIYALTFTADGKTLISGSENHTVREWPVPPPV